MRKGFTFIETLILVAIIGIMSGIAFRVYTVAKDKKRAIEVEINTTPDLYTSGDWLICKNNFSVRMSSIENIHQEQDIFAGGTFDRVVVETRDRYFYVENYSVEQIQEMITPQAEKTNHESN
jgi:prepilin-type N-terminal cleavage/methylation domain-containing protein